MRCVALVLSLLVVPATASAHPPVGIAPHADDDAGGIEAGAAGGAVHLVARRARARLAADKLDGWLLADWRGENPSPSTWSSRAARSIAGSIRPARRRAAAALSRRRRRRVRRAKPLLYRRWRDLDTQLKVLLRGKRRVAMEHSSRLPSLSQSTAGPVDLVRAAGAQPVSSGDLVTTLRARWTDAQLASHRAAAAALVAVKDEAFAAIARGLGHITEYDVQQRAIKALAAHGLEAGEPPVVAAGVHPADPGT